MKGLESAGRAAARQITHPTPPVEERRVGGGGYSSRTHAKNHLNMFVECCNGSFIFLHVSFFSCSYRHNAIELESKSSPPM